MSGFSENIKRMTEQLNKEIGELYTLEQYAFGFRGSVAMVSTESKHVPFLVFEFDNVNKIKPVGRYDSRMTAFEVLSRIMTLNH